MGDEQCSPRRTRRPPSINSRELARLAGVSQSTVSRVLADNPRVAPATRDRVLSIANDAGYVPNLMARGLVTNRSGAIGLVVSNITNPYYPELIEAVCAIAAHHQLSVILCNTQQDPERQREALDLLHQHRVDGLIVTSVMMRAPYIMKLVTSNLPVVFVNRYLPGCRCDVVIIDNKAGAALAVEHLAALGHRRIAYVAGVRDTTTNRDRQRGYDATRQSLGLDRRRSLAVAGDFTAAGAAQAVERLLQLDPVPTGVICADDETALGVLDQLSVRGLKVPGDMAVIGFDDIRLAGHGAISLTTVRQPVATMAQHAMALLLERMRNPSAHVPRRVVLPAELVVRRSCGGGGGARVDVTPQPELVAS